MDGNIQDNFKIIKGFLDGIRPIRRRSPSGWADEFRYLSSVASAEPGRWRTSRTPYLREIMDRFSMYEPCREIVVMKGAQVGLTEMGLNLIGYAIDVDPGPIMYVMPTVDTIKRNSKMRFDPMIAATPVLRDKVGEVRSRDASNTMLQKSFPGGTLILSGANSASSLRSVPIRFLILDEVDAFPQDLEGEGSPVDLAMARTRTFPRRKILMISTPTIEGASVIQKEFEKTRQRRYFVPCPHCNGMQTIEWERIRWEKGRPETAVWVCSFCEAEVQERHKPTMLANGEWRDTADNREDPLIIGYHLNSLYSPLGWYSWADAAADWEEAQKDSTKLKVFINTVLGETWKEKGERPEWQTLFDRRERYDLNRPPADVAIITAGVDVQKDRLEVEVVGWAKGKVSFSLDYRVFVGDTSETSVWDELANMVSEQWERVDGAVLPLSKMCIDTGYNTTQVYKFCRRFHPSQVVPVKGQDRQPVVISQPSPVDRTGKGKAAGSLKLVSVGVSILKSELYGFLKLQRKEDNVFPDGFCHFPDGYDEHFFKMLTAEQLQKEIVKGFPRYVWVKLHPRNEALDCRNYARAAAAIAGIDRWKPEDWDSMKLKSLSSGRSRSSASTDGGKKRRPSNFW